MKKLLLYMIAFIVVAIFGYINIIDDENTILRESFERVGISVDKDNSVLIANISKYVHFDFDKYNIKNRYRLRKVIDELKTLKDKSILIVGHTDSIGSDRYNQKLSQLRAREVYREFLKAGFDKSSLDYVGYGEEQPIASNKRKKGRAKNRRVELIFAKSIESSKDFIKNRDIKTTYLNNHNDKNPGFVEISDKSKQYELKNGKVYKKIYLHKEHYRESFRVYQNLRDGYKLF